MTCVASWREVSALQRMVTPRGEERSINASLTASSCGSIEPCFSSREALSNELK